MILGFKPQFIEPIIKGTKIHTIREDRHNRWKAGNTIQMATGVRTKLYNQFNEGTCFSVQKIEIYYGFLSYFPAILIDGRKLTNVELSELSKNDGFNSFNDFRKWFNKDYTGKIIHFTNFKY